MRTWLKFWPIPALFLAAAFAVAQDPILRVDVRLVRLLSTVRDPAGNLVGTLRREDFQITDNGQPQEIAFFEHHTEQPLSVALLVDISGSTAKDLRYEVESVSRFVKALFAEGNREDTLSLFSFNDIVTKRSPFTNNHSRLDHELRQLRGEAGTALYDAIVLASRELDRRKGRKVMLIVTDGGDTVSYQDFHAALAAAQSADAVMYPILVVPIANDAGRNLGGEHALTSFANGTGGRVFEPTLGSALDAAFTEIIRELRTQYLLGFYPHDTPLTKDRFHRLEVKVNNPQLRVTARSGYYGEAAK